MLKRAAAIGKLLQRAEQLFLAETRPTSLPACPSPLASRRSIGAIRSSPSAGLYARSTHAAHPSRYRRVNSQCPVSFSRRERLGLNAAHRGLLAGDHNHVPDRAKQEVSPGASMDGFTAFRSMIMVSSVLLRLRSVGDRRSLLSNTPRPFPMPRRPGNLLRRT